MITTPASAEQRLPPLGCSANHSYFIGGQGIAVYCAYPMYPPYSYRVVAHCAAGGWHWSQPGAWVPYGFGPSYAKCDGELLTPAEVSSYHVEER
ncbi:hypothetical protein [Amycolatopsis anabasis]|uniref:hypothetical protein n=1 Tax=Amycolatopsis anabasis TaxID=1840409 RepID=UPI00131CEE8C|nr:hypothetical protein [Amycolatopsis anabasis]